MAKSGHTFELGVAGLERMNMNLWLRMPLIFGIGFASGSCTAFLLLRSRLTFYRQFIESRLASIDFSGRPQKAPASICRVREGGHANARNLSARPH